MTGRLLLLGLFSAGDHDAVWTFRQRAGAAADPGAELTDSSQGFREWIENNVEAEALGFHSTFVVEHHFTGFGQVSASLNLLTWLGARTTTLRLGTAVLVLPWHNPVLLAEQAATLDLLSGGRLDFGIGKGYRYNEFAGFCVAMEEADARFDEAMDGDHQVVRLRHAVQPSRPLLAIRQHRRRAADRATRRTRRSGWAPAASARCARSPSAATTCCSDSTTSPRM